MMVKILFWGKGLKNCHESLDFSCGKGWRFLQGSEKISQGVKDFFRGIEICSIGGGWDTFLLVDAYLVWLKLL